MPYDADDNPIGDILTSDEPLVEWLVEDFLPQGSLITLGGEAGAGKSVLSYHLALAVASGLPVLSGLFQTHAEGPQPVVYFDQENSRPDRDQYLRWTWKGLECPDIELLKRFFWSAHFTLGSKDWLARAAEWVERIKPRLIVFDTATPAFAIKDENDNGEATEAISAIRELQALVTPTATAVALKHAKTHMEKDRRRTLRGAKAWEGAVDGVIFHIKSQGRPRSDGLSTTRLEPTKTRAFGLRKTVLISPSWVDDREGLKLRGTFVTALGKDRATENNETESDGSNS